jgi:transcriptional regulator with XRE-family HTH domain
VAAPQEWSERVAALRKELGLRQVEFGSKFGVTQAAVSRWENGAKEPSTENYIKMANMAARSECFWFLEKAGVDVKRFRDLFFARLKSDD